MATQRKVKRVRAAYVSAGITLPKNTATIIDSVKQKNGTSRSQAVHRIVQEWLYLRHASGDVKMMGALEI